MRRKKSPKIPQDFIYSKNTLKGALKNLLMFSLTSSTTAVTLNWLKNDFFKVNLVKKLKFEPPWNSSRNIVSCDVHRLWLPMRIDVVTLRCACKTYFHTYKIFISDTFLAPSCEMAFRTNAWWYWCEEWMGCKEKKLLISIFTQYVCV